MNDETRDPGHGNSPAAWTAAIIIMVSFIAGTVAFWLHQPWFVLASAGLLVVGLIVGWIMKAAGYGVGGDRLKTSTH